LRSRASSRWLVPGLDFTIELPEAAFKLQRVQIEDRAGTRPDKQTAKAGRRVLVVEDEAIVALVLVAGLRSDGWTSLARPRRSRPRISYSPRA